MCSSRASFLIILPSLEQVWTGTTYAVAAAMLQESQEQVKDGASAAATSLRSAAFETARGLWLGPWNALGYWFATPEAYERTGNYRSLGYMRPLSVWAMQWALDNAASK